ncbi:S8 family peptidase [Polaribacter butkevichii]|uniref:Peptidase S8 n=1 Tax=Polaribacter butkevichii TaxID=218490 RepID=A0A2P6C6R1_9FLAO|nr:S8 family peptidase [Polaribacter butkevichii]PQJ68604.1 peptidase S8 [Polaribacter butkevichii]
MRVLKPIFYVAFAGLVFSSCKSISKIPVPQGATTVLNATAKKGTLSEDELNKWSHADLLTDSIPGMSLEKAYQFLSGKKGVEVIVGVVDSGTDLEHEDLKDVAWVNPKEVAGNGIDDDKNGFIDDINGWNFLGSIYKENLEYERIVKNPSIASEEEAKEAKAFYDKKLEGAEKSKLRYEQMLQGITNADDVISKNLNKTDYTKEEVLAIVTEDPALLQGVAIAKQMFSFGLPSLSAAKAELTKLVTSSAELLNGDALKKDYRSAVGDNPNTMDIKVYGNNKTGHSVKDEAHGTHVSGIIAASRNNGIGINGVANHVKIMAVRAVPDGDEYDKDIALGLRYAVDNGAKVINTSFGKGYSPKKEWVYDAIKYAASKDVLIVNAAGNDGKNIDVERTYPNDSKDLETEISDNVLTIGAMSANYNEKLPANFSNYGKKNVDVFAPGVQIYSTTPENEYKKFSGTSMAAPSTVGVAALIRSYYPKLSASQVKHILMNSGIKINFDVIQPGSQSRENPEGIKVPFADLSVSGRVVNAYNALKMADEMVNGKK